MSEEIAKKILLMGLDNAGKTSIVLSLMGRKNLLSYYDLNPTKDRVIKNLELLGSKYNIWDFGGQESYRKNHIEQMDEYLLGAQKIIYVFDIQDKKRYEIALDYFSQILDEILNIDRELELSIFLHKYDPDLFSINPELMEHDIEGFINRIESTIGKRIDFKLFKTTIYTTFAKEPVYFR